MPSIPKDKLHSKCSLPKPVLIPTEQQNCECRQEYNQILGILSGRDYSHFRKVFGKLVASKSDPGSHFGVDWGTFESSALTRNTITLASNRTFGLDPKLGHTPRGETAKSDPVAGVMGNVARHLFSVVVSS